MWGGYLIPVLSLTLVEIPVTKSVIRPISSARLLTDAHYEVKRLIVLDYKPSFNWTEENFSSCW